MARFFERHEASFLRSLIRAIPDSFVSIRSLFPMPKHIALQVCYRAIPDEDFEDLQKKHVKKTLEDLVAKGRTSGRIIAQFIAPGALCFCVETPETQNPDDAEVRVLRLRICGDGEEHEAVVAEGRDRLLAEEVPGSGFTAT